ncbi:RNA-directed DNA polymerase, eukaryota, reverse transcriptase zinc-binding domain protein [Tanacetum coccineum]
MLIIGRSQRNIKITGRYVDSVFKIHSDLGKIRECLARIKENRVFMGMRREMIIQGDKDVSDENVNGISNGSNVTIDKHKSNIIPTFFENGNEVVVFDEELDKERCMKWQLTLCGYLHEDGINIVLEQSPWLVNAKPLVMQKWDPDVNIVKSEPKSRIGFARVLVEIDDAKGYTNKIEIIYMDAEKNVKRRKSIDVEYAWKPLVCSHCVVFGHGFKACLKRTKSPEEIEKDKQQVDRNKGNAKQVFRENRHATHTGTTVKLKTG